MSLAAWWVNDPVPNLPPLPGFEVRVAADPVELTQLTGLTLEEVQARWDAGHQAYMGTLLGRPVTYGWVATRSAVIGELELGFALSAEDRYLWDFATLPEWQGRGLYPRLLQGIAARTVAEAAGATRRLWIIHAPENLPSGAGMHKAGFEPVGELSYRAEGGIGLAPLEPTERAQAGAALLGVPLIDTVLAPCWTCGRAAPRPGSAAVTCWPPLPPAAPPCCCAQPVKPAVLQ